jgi:predicted RNase H-like nuclease
MAKLKEFFIGFLRLLEELQKQIRESAPGVTICKPRFNLTMRKSVDRDQDGPRTNTDAINNQQIFSASQRSALGVEVP